MTSDDLRTHAICDAIRTGRIETVEQGFAHAAEILASPRTAEYARDALDAGVSYEIVIHVKPMAEGPCFTMDMSRYERRPKIQIAHWGNLT